MNARRLAQELGRLGGLKRARRLSPERRREIATLGGRAKWLSLKAAARIEDNFRYLAAVQELWKLPATKQVSEIRHALPDVRRQ